MHTAVIHRKAFRSYAGLKLGASLRLSIGRLETCPGPMARVPSPFEPPVIAWGLTVAAASLSGAEYA